MFPIIGNRYHHHRPPCQDPLPQIAVAEYSRPSQEGTHAPRAQKKAAAAGTVARLGLQATLRDVH